MIRESSLKNKAGSGMGNAQTFRQAPLHCFHPSSTGGMPESVPTLFVRNNLRWQPIPQTPCYEHRLRPYGIGRSTTVRRRRPSSRPPLVERVRLTELEALITEALQAQPHLGRGAGRGAPGAEVICGRSPAGSQFIRSLTPPSAASASDSIPLPWDRPAKPGNSACILPVSAYSTLLTCLAATGALETLAARVDYQRYQLEGARRPWQAPSSRCAITQAKLAGQIRASEAILNSQEEQVGVTRERLRLGIAAPDELFALQL